MGTPTSITVQIDADEYSRYESNKDTITVTVSVTGGAPYASENILIELVKARRSRDAVVAFETEVATSATDPYEFTTTFYLPDIVDQDLISLIRHGKYFVRATHVASDVSGVSEDFDLRIVSVERFKKDYLFGLPLTATNVKLPKYDPVNITGLNIIEVSTNHQEGFGTLSYNYSTDGTTVLRTVSWKGGPVVSLSAPGTYVLKAGASGPASKLPFGVGNIEEYIVVRVKSVLTLPTASTTDDIIIEKQKIDDATLGRFLQQSIDWIENELLSGCYLEPTNVVTDRDPTTIQYAAGINAPTPIFTDTDFDFIVSPLTYFVPQSPGAWVKIQTPYKNLLRVDSLYGAIANTRVIDVDLEWIEHSEKGGLIQLVPFNQEIAFDFLGLLWVNAIRGAAELPNFWRFNMIAGLRDCPADLQELVAKKAAIEALTALALAFRPGIGSVSLSRDGVSESVSYLSQQQYGIYTAAINVHKEWMKENEYKYRAKYRGLEWAVL